MHFQVFGVFCSFGLRRFAEMDLAKVTFFLSSLSDINYFDGGEVDIDALHPVGDVQWTRSAGRMVQGDAGQILVDSVDNGSGRRPSGPKLNRGNHLILSKCKEKCAT